ncbi:unnamed protein product, partial [Arabidopsis halleri]
STTKSPTHRNLQSLLHLLLQQSINTWIRFDLRKEKLCATIHRRRSCFVSEIELRKSRIRIFQSSQLRNQ